MANLTMRAYLTALAEHGINGADRLVGLYPEKVVLRKAEKASDKGYADYGTTPWRAWITDEGRDYLDSDRP